MVSSLVLLRCEPSGVFMALQVGWEQLGTVALFLCKVMGEFLGWTVPLRSPTAEVLRAM